jgi:hypothetical protein
VAYSRAARCKVEGLLEHYFDANFLYYFFSTENQLMPNFQGELFSNISGNDIKKN